MIDVQHFRNGGHDQLEAIVGKYSEPAMVRTQFFRLPSNSAPKAPDTEEETQRRSGSAETKTPTSLCADQTIGQQSSKWTRLTASSNLKTFWRTELNFRNWHSSKATAKTSRSSSSPSQNKCRTKVSSVKLHIIN